MHTRTYTHICTLFPLQNWIFRFWEILEISDLPILEYFVFEHTDTLALTHTYTHTHRYTHTHTTHIHTDALALTLTLHTYTQMHALTLHTYTQMDKQLSKAPSTV